jgi:hypothetical protein
MSSLKGQRTVVGDPRSGAWEDLVSIDTIQDDEIHM